MTVDLRTIRIVTEINTYTITAQCLLPGCHWTMHFAGPMRLGQVTEACEQHPCRPRPCPACGHREEA